MVPGLSQLLDQLTNALNAYVYTLLVPWLTPIIQQATGALSEGSQAVIDTDDQYEVFNDPNASDPSHSVLSKDHFGLILNEPAGKIAQVVVRHTVTMVVEAWSNGDRTDRVINNILESFHHPYFNVGRSEIQNAMMDEMQRWFGGLGGDEGQILAALTKDSVRNGKNKRLGSEGEIAGGGHSHGNAGVQSSYGRNNDNEYSNQSSFGQNQGSGYTPSYEQQPTYGQEETRYGVSESNYGQRQSHRGQEEARYGVSENNYGQRQSPQGQESSYEESRGSYGRQLPYGQETSYEQPQRYREQTLSYEPKSSGYDERRGQPEYGGETRSGYSRNEYSSSRNDDSDSRGDRGQQEYGGYGSRNEYDFDQRSNREGGEEGRGGSHSPQYNRHDRGGNRLEENYGGYGGGDYARDSYSSGPGAGTYGESDRESRKSHKSYESRESHKSHNSQGSYKSQEYEENEAEGTFGAERLNLNDNYEESGY